MNYTFILIFLILFCLAISVSALIIAVQNKNNLYYNKKLSMKSDDFLPFLLKPPPLITCEQRDGFDFYVNGIKRYENEQIGKIYINNYRGKDIIENELFQLVYSGIVLKEEIFIPKFNQHKIILAKSEQISIKSNQTSKNSINLNKIEDDFLTKTDKTKKISINSSIKCNSILQTVDIKIPSKI